MSCWIESQEGAKQFSKKSNDSSIDTMIVKWALIILLGILIGTASAAWILLRPPGSDGRPGVFAVPEQKQGFDVSAKLESEGFIRSSSAFRLLLWTFARDRKIVSGGYRLDPAMNAWQILKTVSGEPSLLWVTTSRCLRKEQVGETVAAKLGWTDRELSDWNTLYRSTQTEYFEGVYPPDTYLLPRDEPVAAVAARFIGNFNNKLSPLMDDYARQNIQWTTGLKIASLIQREAAGPDDMRLISGIIWNRLNRGMRLEIDATMQYTLGRKPDGSWWGAVDLAEKRSNSPYNTYLHKGLPPTPICSPGLDAIRAVLEPEETDCLFYLHDRSRQIHCGRTYADHIRNIRMYLQ